MKIAKLLLIYGFLFTILSGCSEENMKLKNKTITIEYGLTIPTSAKEYLKNNEEFLKDVKVENLPENEKGKDYPAVGEYKIAIKRKGHQEQIKVNIIDTTPPKIEEIKNEYVIYVGESLNLNEIKVSDLSATNILLEDSDVNYQKEGKYNAKVVVKDEYNNESIKQISVVAKKKSDSNQQKTKSETKTLPSVQKKQNSSINQNTSKQKSSSGSVNSESTSQPKDEPPKKSESKPKSLVDSLSVAKSYSKIFVVSSKSYSSRQGTFTYYQKKNGNWEKIFSTSADLGKAGIGNASEGAKKTPIGKFTFTKLMGINANPGTKMNYHRIDSNDYWCGETYYNQFIDEDVHEHNCSKQNDEHLIKYTSQYKYVAAMNYNSGNIKGKGFAYFLHCSNNTHYTGGCIAIPTSKMKTVMREIDNNTVMIVDLEKNIKNY